MAEWKNPPKAKVYEALGAVADGRVHKSDSNLAKVESSAKDKTYTVRWEDGFQQITSDDSASRWQGYIGYPIIAVLIANKVIEVSESTLNTFREIPWNALNKQYKRDYDKVVELVLLDKVPDEQERVKVVIEVDDIYAKLIALSLMRLGR